jgi:2-dehydropantoate 2-reductase
VHIALVGTGSVGSTFAFHLARAGHDVTVVARGRRLTELEREGAIVTVQGERAPVRVCPALPVEVPFGLVLVTVLEHQLPSLLPTLQASAAKTVMFMFNTFASLDPLREAVGSARFAFGFPAVLARLEEGKLRSTLVTVGQITTVSAPRWARVFSDAGIGTAAHPDMQSWLRTHAAFIVPLMAMGFSARAQGRGATWAEASRAAGAMAEGFALVRRLGNAITPTPMRLLGGLLGDLPRPLVVLALWTVSRMRSVTDFAGQGPEEPRALIDAMVAAAPDATTTLASLRP